MTGVSPSKYCQQIEWRRGSCAVNDILAGQPLCLAWGDGKCGQLTGATGIWNCADIKDGQAEKDCYRRFIDQNKYYEARPQGLALCDVIRDEARKARCRQIMTAEGMVKVP